jgi:hypothetical protein
MKVLKMLVVASLVAFLVSCSSPTQSTSQQTQFSATVDYDQSLVASIAAGKYNKISPSIEGFPAEAGGQVNVVFKLVRFNFRISTMSAIAGIDSQGLRPATLKELLAFGAKYPEEQRIRPIIELGTGGPCRYCPPEAAFLNGNAEMRGLDNLCMDNSWDTCFCFLAVPK